MLKWSNLKKDNSIKNKEYFNLQNNSFLYFKLEDKNKFKKYLLSFDIESFKIIELIYLKNGVGKDISNKITTSTINTIKKHIVNKHLEKDNYIWGYCNLNKEKIYYFKEDKNQIFKDLDIKEIDNIKMYIGDKLLNYLIDYKVKIKKNKLIKYYKIKNNFKYNNNRLKCVVEKRKQHYIQKSIIKKFENNNYKFINLKTNKEESFKHKKNFEKEFQEEYLYDLNYKWKLGIEERYSLEKKDISFFENNFNEIYKKIKKEKNIDNNDKKHLVYYLMLQIYRVPRTENTFMKHFREEILNFYYSRIIIKKIENMKINKITKEIVDEIIKYMERYFFSIKIKEYHRENIKNILLKITKNTYNNNPLLDIINILLKNDFDNQKYSFNNLEIKILININENNNISTLTPITELVENCFLYYIIPLDPKYSILFYNKDKKNKILKKLEIKIDKRNKKYKKITKKTSDIINNLNEYFLKRMNIKLKKIIKT